MLTFEVIVFWLVAGVVCFAVWQFLLRKLFSAPARERRRRQRNYGRTVSERDGPTVKLAAKVKRR
jgi:hypothetical protein